AVAEVVDDEDVRRKRRGGKAGDDRREWERSIGNPEREGLSESGGLYVVGAGDGDQPEEDEHEEVAQSIRSKGVGAAGVEYSGGDARQSDYDDRNATHIDEIDSHENCDGEGDGHR